MPARSLPKTFDEPPPDDGRASSDVASLPSEFSDRSARLDGFSGRLDAFRERARLSARWLGMPVPRDDLRGFDRALSLLSLGDGTCGDVFPEPGPGSPDQPTAA